MSTDTTSTNTPATPGATALDVLRERGIGICVESAEYLKIAELSPAPVDATMDFSLVLDAVSKPEYAHLLKDAASYAMTLSKSTEPGVEQETKEATMHSAMDRLISLFGAEMLRAVSGRVSLPLDPRLFAKDPESPSAAALQPSSPSGSVASASSTTSDPVLYSFEHLASALSRARVLLAQTDALDLPRTRVLVQIPATPLGMAVAHALESADARANMTMVHSPVEALASAQAGASVISLCADTTQNVQRVASEFEEYGYMETTEVALYAISTVEGALEMTSSDLASGTGGLVRRVALPSHLIEALGKTPAPSASSGGHSGSGDATSSAAERGVPIPLPEYFSSKNGRTSAQYFQALQEDAATTAKLEADLDKLYICAQMVEELLRAELGQSMAGLNVGQESTADSQGADTDCPSGTSQSASKTDFEDVDLHTPLTDRQDASQSSEAPTQDITEEGSTISCTGSSDIAASPGAAQQHSPSTPDLMVLVPIPEREKPKMSVKARILEIEARLDAEKEGGLIPESTSDVMVSA